MRKERRKGNRKREKDSGLYYNKMQKRETGKQRQKRARDGENEVGKKGRIGKERMRINEGKERGKERRQKTAYAKGWRK